MENIDAHRMAPSQPQGDQVKEKIHHDDENNSASEAIPEDGAPLGILLASTQTGHTDHESRRVNDHEYGLSHKAQIDSKYFENVRRMCDIDDCEQWVGPDPYRLASHRMKFWPTAAALPGPLAKIYERVKASGIPNALGVRQLIPSKLRIDEWDNLFGDKPQFRELLDFIKYGFPMGYLGPESQYDQNYNHSSAEQFPAHIEKFLENEISLGGVLGPFNAKPFSPWLHSSPLMSRPKKDSDNRRIIADLSFPKESSVNAFIRKNAVWGQTREHSLPTVNQLVDRLKMMGPNSYMSTIDISRAYKNFRSDPLDWPLLCGTWKQRYYCDITMPFGARASSYHMQSVANALVHVLDQHGIFARIYLDDIILLSANKHQAEADHTYAKQLLQSLGLPIAAEKIQAPARAVEWLGININSSDMTISIPIKKVAETMRVVKKHHSRRSISKRDLQSLIGRLIHIAKCVAPARLFVSRLLEALRLSTRKFIKITRDMKQDLDWFLQFGAEWNGISLIAPPAPTKFIVVDASLTGIGASDGKHAYGTQVGGDHQIARNISELECINIAVALHSFIDDSYRGAHVQLSCDNMASVQILQTGRGKNSIMLQVARYVWMLQARYGFSITFEHIRGKDNTLADALSRAHVSPSMSRCAQDSLIDANITRINPCLFIFGEINESIFL